MSFFSKLTKEFEGLQSNFSKEKDDGAAQRGYGTSRSPSPKFRLLDVREGQLKPAPTNQVVPRACSCTATTNPRLQTSSTRARKKGTRNQEPGTDARNRRSALPRSRPAAAAPTLRQPAPPALRRSPGWLWCPSPAALSVPLRRRLRRPSSAVAVSIRRRRVRGSSPASRPALDAREPPAAPPGVASAVRPLAGEVVLRRARDGADAVGAAAGPGVRRRPPAWR